MKSDFSKLATDSNSFEALCLAKPNMSAASFCPGALSAGCAGDGCWERSESSVPRQVGGVLAVGQSACPRGPGFPRWGSGEGSGAVSGPREAAPGILGAGDKFRAPGLPEVWLGTCGQTPTQVDSSRRGTREQGPWGKPRAGSGDGPPGAVP